MEKTQVILRKMQTGDVEKVAQFIVETPLWQRYGVTLEKLTHRLRNGIASGASMVVAEDENEVLGFVWVVPKGSFDRDPYIPLIAVRQHKRSLGVGSQLLEHVEKNLLNGSRDIFLLVSDFNTSAQRFYERHGYLQVGAVPNYILEGVSEVMMWKRCG